MNLPPRLPPLPEDGAAVFVAECGHGARPGKVVRTYSDGKARRVVVAFTDMPPRDCFAASVFRNRTDAEDSANA